MSNRRSLIESTISILIKSKLRRLVWCVPFISNVWRLATALQRKIGSWLPSCLIKSLSGLFFGLFANFAPPNVLLLPYHWTGQADRHGRRKLLFITQSLMRHVGLDIRFAGAERTCGNIGKYCVCAFAWVVLPHFDCSSSPCFVFRSCHEKRTVECGRLKFCCV